MDDHSVGNFIESTPWCETIAGAFQNRESMQKPSDSNDSDSSDSSDPEFWPDIYYLKAFDSSDQELSMTTEIVEGKSHKFIAYRRETWRKPTWRFLDSEVKAVQAIQAWWKAMKATKNKEQQDIVLFSVCFCFYLICFVRYCFRPTASTSSMR